MDPACARHWRQRSVGADEELRNVRIGAVRHTYRMIDTDELRQLRFEFLYFGSVNESPMIKNPLDPSVDTASQAITLPSQINKLH